jgi:hypothetical protein
VIRRIFAGQIPDPEPGAESKSLLVLFFRKEQNLLLSYEKEAKRLSILALHYDSCFVPNQPLGGKRHLSVDSSLDGEVSSYEPSSVLKRIKKVFTPASLRSDEQTGD